MAGKMDAWSKAAAGGEHRLRCCMCPRDVQRMHGRLLAGDAMPRRMAAKSSLHKTVLSSGSPLRMLMVCVLRTYRRMQSRLRTLDGVCRLATKLAGHARRRGQQ